MTLGLYILKWLNPKKWWEIKLIKWLKLKHPEKLSFDPKILNITGTHIEFGMKKHFGILLISKERILNDLK